MRLPAADLACLRGRPRRFCRVRLFASGGEACWSPGRNGAGKSSLLRLIAGLLRSPAGSSRSKAATPNDHRRAGALSRPPRRLEAFAVGRKTSRSGPRYLGGAERHRRGVDGRRPRRRLPTCRPPICRPASGGGCRSRGCSPCRGRSGCSTSRPSALDARGAGDARRMMRRAPRRRRPDRRGGARPDRARPRAKELRLGGAA